MNSFSLFAAVLAAVCFVLQGTPTRAGDLHLHQGLRIYARDYRVMSAAKSIDDCKEECAKIGECVEMTFDRENLVCHIFYGRLYKGADANFVAWPNVKNYQIPNTCLSKPTRSVPSVFAFSRCKSVCEKDPQCKGSTFHFKAMTCTIHYEISGVTKDKDCTTWTRDSEPGLIGGICFTNGYTQEPADSGLDCRTNCLKDSKCRASSFNSDTKQCTKATRDYDVTTGSQCQSFVPLEQINLRHGLCLGNEYELTKSQTLIECYETCGDDSKCKAMTFNSNTKSCQLLDAKYKTVDTSNKDCESWISSRLVRDDE